MSHKTSGSGKAALSSAVAAVASVLIAGGCGEPIDGGDGDSRPQLAMVRLERLGELRAGDDAAADALRAARAVRPQLGLSERDDFVVLSARRAQDGLDHVRMRQTHAGVPIWGAEIAVHASDAEVQMLTGNVLPDLPADGMPEPALWEAGALELARNDYALQGDGSTDSLAYLREAAELVLLPGNDALILAWHVELATELQRGIAPGRWHYFVDATTGGLIEQFNASDTLSQASGPGGNPRFANQWVAALDVEPSGALFAMATARQTTLDMHHGSSGGTIVTGPLSPIGDAAINDAHGYTEATLAMLSEWFGYDSIDDHGFPIISRVHYGSFYENAFWDGVQMTYGDGGNSYHALSTGMDVVGHEIGHGFTEKHSDLIYDGMSGGLNESFSDIQGTALEFFFRPSTADFDIGEDVKVAGALRYMCDPPRDGLSIDHAAEFTPDLDVHFSSGVMNKAFCLTARRISSGSPTGTATPAGVERTARAFYLANEAYWVASSTFTQGCQGTIDAANALGYTPAEIEALSDSWADVGVLCGPRPPDLQLALDPHPVVLLPGGSGSSTLQLTRFGGLDDLATISVLPLPPGVSARVSPHPVASSATLTLTSTATTPIGNQPFAITAVAGGITRTLPARLLVVGTVESGVPTQNLSAVGGAFHYLAIVVPPTSTRLDVTFASGTGSAILYLRHRSLPTAGSYACRRFVSGTCTILGAAPGTWFIALAGDPSFVGGSVTATHSAGAPPAVSDVILSPTTVMGGYDSVGSVWLDQPARAGGTVVSMTSSHPSIARLSAATITVPAGSRSEVFVIRTVPVSATQVASILATAGGRTIGKNLTIRPATLSTIGVSPNSVPGGSPSTGTVTLTGPAPEGGFVVALSSSQPAVARVPSAGSVTVPAGRNNHVFAVTTSVVTAAQTATISARAGIVTKSVLLRVNPPALSSVSLSPTTVMGGASVTGTVRLTAPALAGGQVVTLSSSHPAIAAVPPGVLVPEGSMSRTFVLTTFPTTARTSVVIDAVAGGVSRAAGVTVTPSTFVSALALSPYTVTGGATSTGTITLNAAAPAGGLVVTLASSNVAVATVPPSVTVPAGSTTRTFTVVTREVSSTQTSSIRAVSGGQGKARTLTVNP